MSTLEFIEKFSVSNLDYNELDYENSIEALTKNRVEKLELLLESIENFREGFVKDEAIKLMPSRFPLAKDSKESLQEIIKSNIQLIKSHDFEKASKALSEKGGEEIQEPILKDLHLCFLIKRVQMRIQDNKVEDENEKQLEKESNKNDFQLIEPHFFIESSSIKTIKNPHLFQRIEDEETLFRILDHIEGDCSKNLLSAIFFAFEDNKRFIKNARRPDFAELISDYGKFDFLDNVQGRNQIGYKTKLRATDLLKLSG